MNTSTPSAPPGLLADEPEPPFPEKPDCCFGGCAVCVLDGYAEEVAAWQQRVAEIRARREAAARAQNSHP
jgi:hypothetical protein